MDRQPLAIRSIALGASAVIAATSFVACTDGKPPKVEPTSARTPEATPTGPRSNLAGLNNYGVDIGTGVLIDVAGDGRDRFMNVRKNGAVDFRGTNQNDATWMVLSPAAVKAADRVVINAPRWNPELGAGYCVAASPVMSLTVVPCRFDDPDQIWLVVPVGDSGQFRLEGHYGAVHVDDDRVTPDGKGRTGLQTVPFTE